MHVNVRHKQQQQQQQREHTTVATTTTRATTVRTTFVVNFQRHRKCFLQQTNENMKSFYAHTQVIIWAQLVATFRVPATIFGQKLLPTAAGKKVLATATRSACNKKHTQRRQTKHLSAIRQMQKLCSN